MAHTMGIIFLCKVSDFTIATDQSLALGKYILSLGNQNVIRSHTFLPFKP